MAMRDWVKRELRANFVRASRAGRHAARAEPRAARAAYGVTTVSHGRGHWFDPSTAHQKNQRFTCRHPCWGEGRD